METEIFAVIAVFYLVYKMIVNEVRASRHRRAIIEIAHSLRNTNYKVNGTMTAFKGDEEIESTVGSILNGYLKR